MDLAIEDPWYPVVDQAAFNESDIPIADEALMQGLDYNFTFSDCERALEPHRNPSHTQSFSNLWQPNGSTTSVSSKSRVSLACVPCRSRHAKCDARVPTCSQCHESSRACSYATSRRKRGKASCTTHRHQSMGKQLQSENGSPSLRRIQGEGPLSNGISFVNTSLNDLGTEVNQIDPSYASRSDDPSQRSMLNSDESARYLNIYYQKFHDAHPFVLPQHFLNKRLKTDKCSLLTLLPILEFVGSLYVPSTAKEGLKARAESALSRENLPANGFTVQSLLIFAIAVHSCNDFGPARGILDHAIQMTLQINMHSKSFSMENSEGCSVLGESWRRTWWYLYMTDSVFAGIRHCSKFTLRDIETSVDLPCEEALYQSGDIPHSQTLEEYETREFAPDELVFSSFAYLIDLALISGSVLALRTTPREPFNPDVISVEARFVNWISYLPKEKQLVVTENGKIDEIMFQAHMSFNTLKVVLHRPLSQLKYSPLESTSKCAPPPSGQSAAERQRAYDFHTTKVLEAAEACINLLTLPGPFTTHTPLVICSLTLCILAEISACRFKLVGPAYTSARDRVRLGLVASKIMGEVWTVGANTVKELQIIARETLSLQT